MASTINADNGVVSGTSGIKLTSDSSGVLAIQSSGTTTATFDTSGNLTITGGLTAAGSSTLSGGTANGVLYLNGSKAVTSGSALVFDGSNLGLNVTPSSWGSGRAIEIGYNGNAVWSYSQTDSYFTQNAKFTDAWRYVSSAAASTYRQSSGVHYWNIASSGTAGNTITFTQAMTLDNSGNLTVTGTGNPTLTVNSTAGAYTSILKLQAAGGGGSVINATGASSDLLAFQITSTEQMRLTSTGLGIGTSSPSQKLEVSGAIRATITPSNSVQASFLLANSGTTNAANFQLNTSGGLAIWNYQNGGVGWFNSATIDTNGNLGLGVTPSAWTGALKALQVGTTATIAGGSGELDLYCNAYNNGTNVIYQTSSYASQMQMNNLGQFRWYIAPSGTAGSTVSFTQAMTLDNNSNLYIGTTSYGSGVGSGVAIRTAFSGNIGDIDVGHASGAASGSGYMNYFYNGTNIGSITQNGTTGVLYNITSDQRLKTNIVDAPEGNVDAIKVRSFDWIADGSHQIYGMIAQELLEVAPYAVSQPSDPEGMMGVDYSKLVPMLIKEIQSLRARVAQLETKGS